MELLAGKVEIFLRYAGDKCPCRWGSLPIFTNRCWIGVWIGVRFRHNKWENPKFCVDVYIAVAILICINTSENSDLNFTIFRQKVCTHLCIYFAKIFPNEFLRTAGHTTAGIPAKKNKRQNCSETTLLIAILAF